MAVDLVEVVAVPVLKVNPLDDVVRVDPVDDESNPPPVPEHPKAVDP